MPRSSRCLKSGDVGRRRGGDLKRIEGLLIDAVVGLLLQIVDEGVIELRAALVPEAALELRLHLLELLVERWRATRELEQIEALVGDDDGGDLADGGQRAPALATSSP